MPIHLRPALPCITTHVCALAQAKQDASELQEKSKGMKAAIVEADVHLNACIAARERALLAIGNLVHESVPVDDNEVRSCRLSGSLAEPTTSGSSRSGGCKVALFGCCPSADWLLSLEEGNCHKEALFTKLSQGWEHLC